MSAEVIAFRPRRRFRPWWFWLMYYATTGTLLWMLYRTLAGRPEMGGLLMRLGG